MCCGASATVEAKDLPHEGITIAMTPALRERSRLYGWLARLFLAEPTQSDVLSYRSGEGRRVLEALQDDPALGPGAAAMGQSLDRAAARGQPAVALAGAYGRLFHGFGGRRSVPPYQSVHEGDSAATHGAAWRRMRALLDELGLAKPDGVSEPEDHIGIQLAVMAHLCDGAARAAEDGDGAAWTRAIERQRRFLADHLLAWGPDFCAACIANDEDGFYAGAARILAALLVDEQGSAGMPVRPL